MSQQTYTFACPVCAVRLSVPKALAGVRGPCPQCHHDITAPEPEAVLEPALASAGLSEARSAPAALAVDPPPPIRPVPPPVTVAPPPLPTPPASVPRPAEIGASALRSTVPDLAEAVAAISTVPPPSLPSTPDLDPVPPPLPAGSLPSLPEAVPAPPVRIEPMAPAVAVQELSVEAPVEDDEPVDLQLPPARRSRLGRAVAALLVLGLLAAAALNLLPRQSLRHWIGKVLPAAAVDTVMGPDASATPSATTTAAANSPGPVVPSPGPVQEAAVLPEASPDDPSSPVEIRPALAAPESLPDTVAAAPEAPVGPSFAPAAEAVAADPAAPAAGPQAEPAVDPPAASPETTTTTTAAAAAAPGESTPPADPPQAAVPASPGAATAAEAGVASLLPDISGGPQSSAAAVDDARAGAQEALTLFLQARKWSDRIALSHGSEGLQAEMAAYYKKAKDGPNPPTSVDYIASGPAGPDGKSTVEVFHVTFADLPQGFPVSVRHSEEGWKVDWQAFVEFREGRLKKFLAQYQEAPATFRVRLQRARYQDTAVPNLDQKYVFRVAAPIDGHEGYVFVDKEDSIVGPKVAEMLGWEDTHLVMAKLKWVRATSGRPYVELRDIVSQSWREAP